MDSKPDAIMDDCPTCGARGMRNRGHTCVAVAPGYVTLAHIKQLQAEVDRLREELVEALIFAKAYKRRILSLERELDEPQGMSWKDATS